ncbi:MAG: hypothetical protein Q9214_002168 [Letrouitia sp. 1 TL-2023]
MATGLTPASSAENDEKFSGSEMSTPAFSGSVDYSAVVHPHVGDAYFTGNIYEHAQRITNEAATRNRSLSNYGDTYLRHIKALSLSWPRLLYLAEFMEASTAPAKAKLLSVREKAERLNRVKASVLSFSDVQDVERKDSNSLEGLTYLLKHSDSNIKKNRLIVLEDLSSGLIELLGSHFDVDPRFFRSHLEDHTWFNTKDPWVELPELDSTIKSRSYFTIRYVQARYFENDLYSQAAKRQAGSFNVLRRIDLEGSAESGTDKWWDGTGGSVGIIRHKVSLWVKPQRENDTWTGILLLDPSLTEGHLLWNGYGNLDSPPSIHEKRQLMSTSSLSFSETFISQAMTIGPTLGAVDNVEPEFITAPLYPLIFGQWLVALEYTFTGLFQVEWHIDASRVYEPQDPSRQRGPKELDDCLQRLHKWQRRLPFFTSWLESTITSLEGRYRTAHATPFHQQSNLDQDLSPNAPKLWTGIISDFRTLHTRFSNLALRADKILNIATAITSVQENKRAIEQSQRLTLITYLAFIFIPLSFVSSFLSMNGDFSSQRKAYPTFFEVGLPMCLLALGAAVYGRHLQRFWIGLLKKA